jgi:tryptophanyl-tRNA synthetase
MRVLSGIQPSGPLHIGNDFGAIRQFVSMQNEANEVYYFVANYHALTSLRDAAKLRQYTWDVVADLLALGVDPERATLFVQSDVPETTELAWLLTSVTPMPMLQNATSYKDKVAQGLPADHGLFAYPVLQAADILLYDADAVPVGKDQKQHIEITRDIAVRFNETYGPTFKLPEPKIVEQVAVIPGLDNRKMSKSYNNTIEIFDDPKTILKKCKKLVTDSRQPEDPGTPDGLSAMGLFPLLRLFAPESESLDFEQRYLNGGLRYGDAKARLAELIAARYEEPRARRADLVAHPERVEEVRRAGAKKARQTARAVLTRARAACGVD